MEYPILAAKQAAKLDRIYLSTDDEEMKRIARAHGIGVIDRPPELSGADSKAVDALLHAMEQMPEKPDVLVRMHCNCATHKPGLIDECVRRLEQHPEADSCVSGIIENGVHPLRTKQVRPDGYLDTWMEMADDTSDNRQDLVPCFVLDGACRAIRVATCFPAVGQPPFRYLGNRILYVENPGSCEVDNLADIAYTEHYLRTNGVPGGV